MTLPDIKAIHNGLSVPAYHYGAGSAKAPYVVWAEDGEGASGHADNRKTTRIIAGSTDYFTNTADYAVVSEIEAAFISSELAWTLNSIQYEDTSGLLHYEWRWEAAFWQK